ncbi:MAG TPA: M15 family metallopeptidase [Actinomycetota bacterium]|nr:M15 family metallopeptidase [Actinomycetota bacterium]
MAREGNPGRHALAAMVVVVALFSVGCAAAARPDQRTVQPAPMTRTPSPSPSTSPIMPAFGGTIARIDDATRARMISSWHEGCPVGLEDLRLLHLSFWDFHGRVRTGELVVHADVARDVVGVFRRLFDARFPIERMRLVDAYGGDDDRSMAADNTSAFNCRSATGHPGVWSEHSYGRAVDINPLRNPYVASDGSVLPPSGTAYADRSRRDAGVIHDGDVVVRAFVRIGWEWGGLWSSFQDYQHFSSSGR